MRNVIRIWAVLFLMSLAGCINTRPKMTTLPAAIRPNPVPITILHTNDVHGHAWPVEDKTGTKRGGYAALAKLYDTIWREVDSKGGITLLLSAGDVNTGMPESDLANGEPDFVAMSNIGFDAMVLGNHEFDHGTELIERQKQWANFPMLSANVLWKKDKAHVAQPALLLERGDITFGIIGLTTADLPILVSKQFVEPLIVQDPVQAAKIHAKELKARGADIIVALTHMGVMVPDSQHFHRSNVDDRKLAEAVPELNAVVGGHSHVLLREGLAAKNGIPIVQAGHKGEYLGRLDLLWDEAKKKVISWKASVIEVLPSQGEEKALAKVLNEYRDRSKPLLDQPLAEASVALEGERDIVRSRESNLGNLICDCLREQTGSEIAIYNGGGIRSSIPAGTVRVRDVYKVLPFANTVVTLQLNGKQLREALEAGLKYSGETGSFLQVSGLTMRHQGTKVVDLKVNDRPVSTSKKYRLSTNSFVLGGGDHMEVLRSASDQQDTGLTADRVFADCLRKRGTINASVEGRIQSVEGQPSRDVTGKKDASE